MHRWLLTAGSNNQEDQRMPHVLRIIIFRLMSNVLPRHGLADLTDICTPAQGSLAAVDGIKPGLLFGFAKVHLLIFKIH